MKNKIIYFLMLFLVIIPCACTKNKKPDTKQTPIPKTLQELKTEIEKTLADNKIPGVGIALVSKDGIIWAGGLGKADVASNKDITAKTHFRVGSISKSFIALALLKLTEEGKVDLNANLKDVIPNIKIENPWDSKTPVKVVHLLEHTSGFDDMHFNEAYNIKDPHDIPLNDILAINPHSRIVRWEPGTRAAYSNPGYGVAGYVIERVTNEKFEDYVKKTILDPIGMTTSSYTLTSMSKSLLAQGYKDDKFTPVPFHFIYLRPAGSLNSSPEEMGLFVQFMLNRGRVNGHQVISEKSLERVETVETTLAAQRGLKNGYGLANYVDLRHSLILHGHDGGIDGFVSTYRYSKEYGFGFVTLYNTTSGGDGMKRIRELIFNYLSKDIKIPEPLSMKIDASQLQRYAGYYEAKSPRNQLLAFLDSLLGGVTISYENGKLMIKEFMQDKKEIIPMSDHLLRREKEPDASIIFTSDNKGNQILVADTGWSFYEKSSPWKLYVYRGFVFGSLILMASSILFALIWLPLRIFRRKKKAQYLRARAVPLLAVLTFVGSFLLLQFSQFTTLGTLNSTTVGFCLITWLFALLSFYGFILSLRSFSYPVNKAIAIHCLLVSMANCGITLYLAYWHIIGLQLWSF